MATDLLYSGFNQDQGCFACGLKNGFKVFNTEPLREKESIAFNDGGIGFVEMLFRCNYIALIGGGKTPKYSRNKVIIWDDVKKREMIELEFASEVKSVRLRRDRIVVVLEAIIKIYSFKISPQLLSVIETAYNPRGICALCPSSNNSFVAILGRDVGSVRIADLSNLDKAPLLIPAHENQITCIEFNQQGTRLVTASSKGTLLRIFDALTGEILQELRRGSNPAIIYSIAFSHDSTMICVTSNHATLHIFALDQKAIKTNSYIPKYFQSKSSFTKIEIPSSLSTICAFGPQDNSVIVISSDGSYFKWVFNPNGQWHRQEHTNFLENPDLLAIR